MMQQVEYSKELGYSANYLSQYKQSRKLPTRMTAQEVHRLCLAEKAHQESISNACIVMYFELKETRRLHAFGRHIEALGIYNRFHSFMMSIDRYFIQPYGLRPRSFIDKQERVLKAYKEWQ